MEARSARPRRRRDGAKQGRVRLWVYLVAWVPITMMSVISMVDPSWEMVNSLLWYVP